MFLVTNSIEIGMWITPSGCAKPCETYNVISLLLGTSYEGYTIMNAILLLVMLWSLDGIMWRGGRKYYQILKCKLQ
jgi:hypothetical protein